MAVDAGPSFPSLRLMKGHLAKPLLGTGSAASAGETACGVTGGLEERGSGSCGTPDGKCILIGLWTGAWPRQRRSATHREGRPVARCGAAVVRGAAQPLEGRDDEVGRLLGSCICLGMNRRDQAGTYSRHNSFRLVFLLCKRNSNFRSINCSRFLIGMAFLKGCSFVK